MSPHRPYALLAELTYRCPLHCPYCSNPTTYPTGSDLATSEWQRLLGEAAALGVMHVGFSGGEPLLRRDLAELIATARTSGLYTNLITSGVGLNAGRAAELHEAGLDSAQVSFQADIIELADQVAGAKAHESKIYAMRHVRESGIALSLNVVLHRATIERLPQIIAFAASCGAERLELANVQYYGWGFLNRAELLPTREQVTSAFATATEAKERFKGKMEIFYVLPDYYESYPKPCLNGWGRRYITVNPGGDVLPCPTAGSIPGLTFENVRAHSLEWIWEESASFNSFRGTEWMEEPCRSCPRRETDFGGCRCQAALLTNDAARTDPVCTLSPDRKLVDRVLEEVNQTSATKMWQMRRNPVAVR